MLCGTLFVASWQGLQSDSISSGNTRLLMIFVGIVALSMLTQAVAVVFIAIGAKRAQARLMVIVDELRTKATPILERAEDLTGEAVPKIKTITENLLQTSQMVRLKAQELGGTVTDANSRAKAQVARVDSMVSTALTATGTLAAMIHHGIKTPVVEAIGLVNGVKAGLDVFMSKSKNSGSKGKAVTLYKRDSSSI